MIVDSGSYYFIPVGEGASVHDRRPAIFSGPPTEKNCPLSPDQKFWSQTSQPDAPLPVTNYSFLRWVCNRKICLIFIRPSDPKPGRKSPISSEAGFPTVSGVLLFHTDM